MCFAIQKEISQQQTEYNLERVAWQQYEKIWREFGRTSVNSEDVKKAHRRWIVVDRVNVVVCSATFDSTTVAVVVARSRTLLG